VKMDFNKMLQQAQQMQAQMLQAQEEARAEVVEASAGGGMVTVRMTGHKQLAAVSIDPEIVAANDPAMLADLVLVAVNEAARKVDEAMQERVGAMTGGLPGLV